MGETKRSFVEFFVSVCAIVGGLFTVAGIFDGLLHAGVLALAKKAQLGKLKKCSALLNFTAEALCTQLPVGSAAQTSGGVSVGCLPNLTFFSGATPSFGRSVLGGINIDEKEPHHS